MLITFDDLPPNTVVDHQYDDMGISFVQPYSGFPSFPFTTAVAPGEAASGNQVASISQVPGAELFQPQIKGIFLGGLRQTVSVDVGAFTSSRAESHVLELLAYDAAGNIITSSSVAVTSSGGFHTPLTVTTGGPTIASFILQGTLYNGALLGMDNLSFDDPTGPDFALTASPSHVQVSQGGTVDVTVTIARYLAPGAIMLTPGGLASGSGISSSFTIDPVTTDSTVLILLAAADAALTGDTPIVLTITGTSTSVSGPRTATLLVDVVPAFTINSNVTTLSVVGCTSGFTVHITVSRGPGFSGVVSLATGPLLPGVTVSFDPPMLDFSSTTANALTSIMTVDITMSTPPSTTITVLATSGALTTAPVTIALAPTPPTITSIDPLVGHIPEALQPGTAITFHGTGFCADSQVRFNSDPSTPAAYWSTPDSISADGRTLVARVPRLATTCQPTIVMAGGAIQIQAPQTLTVQSYRNTAAFCFVNTLAYDYFSGSGFGAYEHEFGQDQMFFSFNLCGWFGVDCTAHFLDPIALIFYTVSALLIDSHPGLCVGMSLSSLRYLYGADPLPLAAATDAYELDSPSGPDVLLYEHLAIQHLAQLGYEYLQAMLTELWESHRTPAKVYQSIEVEFWSGPSSGKPYPLLALRNPSKLYEGHTVVVTDVETDFKGNYLIWVYDPDNPYDITEDSTFSTHQQNMETLGTIWMDSTTGDWQFVGRFTDSPWLGKLADIVPISYRRLPTGEPTIPHLTNAYLLPAYLAALGAVFLSGSAGLTQVSDTVGHRLFNADGSINTDPATRLPGVSPLPTFAANPVPGGPAFRIGLQDIQPYTHTVVGTGAGKYSLTMFSVNSYTRVYDIPTELETADTVVLDAKQGVVEFETLVGGRAYNAEVAMTRSDGSGRIGGVSTAGYPGGRSRLSFAGSQDALIYEHSGERASVSLTLSAAGTQVHPATVATPAIPVTNGDSVRLTADNWDDLLVSPLTLAVQHQDKTEETRRIVPDPILKIIKGPTAGSGKVYFEVRASQPNWNPVPLGVVEATSNPNGPWQVVSQLSGYGPTTVQASFDVTDATFGGSSASGLKRFYVRVMDAQGRTVVTADGQVLFGQP